MDTHGDAVFAIKPHHLAKEVVVLPIRNSAPDDPHFKTEQFKNLFEELNSLEATTSSNTSRHLSISKNLGNFYD